MKVRSNIRQKGVSLVGLIFILAIIGLVAVIAMKVVPTVSEYMSIKKAIGTAKAAGITPAEVRSSFDKQANVGYITSISSRDLEIEKNGDGLDISFEYEKKISLMGPVSLLIEYEGSTAPRRLAKAKQDK